MINFKNLVNITRKRKKYNLKSTHKRRHSIGKEYPMHRALRRMRHPSYFLKIVNILLWRKSSLFEDDGICLKKTKKCKQDHERISKNLKNLKSINNLSMSKFYEEVVIEFLESTRWRRVLREVRDRHVDYTGADISQKVWNDLYTTLNLHVNDFIKTKIGNDKGGCYQIINAIHSLERSMFLRNHYGKTCDTYPLECGDFMDYKIYKADFKDCDKLIEAFIKKLSLFEKSECKTKLKMSGLDKKTKKDFDDFIECRFGFKCKNNEKTNNLFDKYQLVYEGQNMCHNTLPPSRKNEKKGVIKEPLIF